MATFVGSVNDVKSQWFAAQGFASNTLNDQISRYLSANGGGISNDLTTQWRTFLEAKGQAGTINDMMKAELIKSLGGGYSSSLSLSDLERAFYSTSTNSFL